MNTSIRFPSRTADVEKEVCGLLQGKIPTNELEDAAGAVVNAFHSADSMAGSGNGHTSRCTNGNFYALADIDSGEFFLYKLVL